MTDTVVRCVIPGCTEKRTVLSGALKKPTNLDVLKELGWTLSGARGGWICATHADIMKRRA